MVAQPVFAAGRPSGQQRLDHGGGVSFERALGAATWLQREQALAIFLQANLRALLLATQGSLGAFGRTLGHALAHTASSK